MQDGISSPMLKAAQATEHLLNAQEQAAHAVEQTELAAKNMASGASAVNSQMGKMATAANLAGDSIASMGVDAANTLARLKALGAYQDNMGRWHGENGKYINPTTFLGNNSSSPILPPKIPTVPIETKLEQPSNTHSFMSKLQDSLAGQFAIGSIAGNAILNAVEQISSIPGMLVKASDAYSGIQARLNLVAGSQEKAVELNEAIYQSALRANGSYSGMADAVSKIAMTAKEAFPDPKQVVPFMENIQKMFSIGGTDAEHQADALLQLTQALGSGKLQGDELRSIAEAAPMIEQEIAKYMGVSMGDIKQLGSEGQITADIMKNAILSATDDINKKFDSMPLKWEDIWTNMQSQTTHALAPIYTQFSKLANTGLTKGTANALIVGVQVFAAAVSGLINNFRWLLDVTANFYNQNKYGINGIISGFGGVLGVILLYKSYVLATIAVTKLWAAISTVGKILQFVTYLPTAISLIRTLGVAQAITAMTAVEMWGAMILPIAAVVAGIYFLSDGFTEVTSIIEYGLSMLVGLIMTVSFAAMVAAGAWALWNALQLISVAYSALQNVALITTNAQLAIAYIRYGLVTAATALWTFATSGLVAMLRALNLTILLNPIGIFITLVVLAISAFVGWQVASNGLRNTLAEVFTVIADTVASAINFMIEKINGLISAFNAVKSLSNEVFGTSFSATNEITWRAEGWGAKAGNFVRNFDIHNYLPDIGAGGVTPSIPNMPSNIPSYGDMGGAGAGGDDGTAKNIKDTADNTKAIADALEMTADEIKELRDVAMQETMNTWNDQHIIVNIENNNSINSDTDIDSMTSDLVKGIQEAIQLKQERAVII